ncbi:MAG TPA: ROK family transcriptional regulator [Gaiellaceae bacterium]|jgi:predicted NBD/HSP70 family sugar kinase|nr:ROK family transcriptional regulator [Gaiellaceae bacterium]
MATKATPPLLKRLNERTVLEAIRTDAPISRAEISRRAGISKPTVSIALQSLLEAGLVREARPDPARPSYGAVFFEPVPEAAFVLGVDVGARFVRGALCDLRGATRARQDVELRGPAAADVVETIGQLSESLLDAAGIEVELVDSTVVGVPGVIDRSSGRVHITHFESLEGFGLADALRDRLRRPVTLENDINLAALGEQRQGIAHGVENFVFLSIGTGLGAGVVLHGELHRGRNGAAGEVDFAFAGLGEDVDPCASAVSALAERMAAGDGRTSTAPPYEARAIFAAARAGDDVARAVVDETARRIALHIGPIAAVTDVELVVLGGGLGANGDLLLGPVRERLAAWLPYPPRVEVSSLGEAAVLTGALAVGLRSALENVFDRRSRLAAT